MAGKGGGESGHDAELEFSSLHNVTCPIQAKVTNGCFYYFLLSIHP